MKGRPRRHCGLTHPARQQADGAELFIRIDDALKALALTPVTAALGATAAKAVTPKG